MAGRGAGKAAGNAGGAREVLPPTYPSPGRGESPPSAGPAGTAPSSPGSPPSPASPSSAMGTAGGHHLSPEAALRSAGPRPNPAIWGDTAAARGEKAVGAAPPPYLLGQSHGHRLPQLREAAVDAVPPPLLNHFVGNRSPLQNIRGALAGEDTAEGCSRPRPGVGPSREGSPRSQPRSQQRCRARRGLEEEDAPVFAPLRATPGLPDRGTALPRQACFEREVWLFFAGGFRREGGSGLGARPARRPRRAVRARRARTHPPLLELGGHGGLCVPSLPGPLIKPSLLGGDPGGPPRAR